mgnify:CR=1 FL=1
MDIYYPHNRQFKFINVIVRSGPTLYENYEISDEHTMICSLLFNGTKWYYSRENNRKSYAGEQTRLIYSDLRNKSIQKAKEIRFVYKESIFKKFNLIRSLIHPDVIPQILILLNDLLPVHYLETVEI